MCMIRTENIVYHPRVQQIAQLENEISLVLYLTHDGRVLGNKNYNKIGNVEGVELPQIGDVVKGCRINKTNKVILLHNHPYLYGGYDPTPSKQDLQATQRFKDELAKYGIELVDHIIVCPQGYFSFRFYNLL